MSLLRSASGRRAAARRLAALLTLVCAVSLAAPARAEAQECELGLVLSGGGARGLAHIGALEVLVENGVWPDCIAGASMGSIIGALFAAGHSPEEIRTMLSRLSWRDLFSDAGSRRGRPILHRLEQQRTALRLGVEDGTVRLPRSLLDDTIVNRILIEHLTPANFVAGRDFSRLPIPFRGVGTDLLDGERIVLRDGDLARAVRGSMSVPLAYSPVEWGEELLIDGGLVDNVPVSLAEEMGARYVIAIDVSTPIEPELVPDLAGVTNRIIDLLFAEKNAENRRPPDLRIEPAIGNHSFADYSRTDFLIEQARRATRDALSSIPAAYRDRPPPRREHPHGEIFADRTVTEIRVEGNEYLSDQVLLREFTLEPGDPVDFQAALAHLDHLAGSGLLTRAWMDLQPDGADGVAVVLQVTEEYRNTVDVGLAYQTDHQAQGLLRFETRNLLGAGDRLQLSGFVSARDLVVGARLHGEQALGAHFGYVIDVEHERERPKVYEGGASVNRAEFRRVAAQAVANLPFSLDSLLQAGFRIGEVETRERLGLDFPAGQFQERILMARYIRDNMSSLVLPDSGTRITLLAERNEETLGGTASYWRFETDARVVFPLGAVTGQLRVFNGLSSGELPIHEWFRLGGPELLPGLAREEIWGRQALAGSFSIGYDLTSIIRAHLRAGAGNVWDEIDLIEPGDLIFGAGLGFTVATPIGPIVAEYGWAEESRNRFYFSIGWQ